jgi:uncharacterized protein YgiB involved in biofilm formation
MKSTDTFNFGKYKGLKTLKQVINEDPSYILWLSKQESTIVAFDEKTIQKCTEKANQPTDKQVTAFNNMTKALGLDTPLPETKAECVKLISSMKETIGNQIKANNEKL